MERGKEFSVSFRPASGLNVCLKNLLVMVSDVFLTFGYTKVINSHKFP